MHIRQIILVLSCFFSVQFSFAKETSVSYKVDSLKKIIETSTNDTLKVKCWIEWDNLIYYDEPETDLKLNQQVAEFCESKLSDGMLNAKTKKFYQKSIGSAYNNLGSIFQFRGEMKKSLNYLHKGLKYYLQSKHLPGIANSYGNLGISYSIMGDDKTASEYMMKAMKVQEQLKDELSIAATLNNLALIFKDQGMNEKALEYCHKALEIRLKLKDEKGISSAYSNLASMYFDDGQIEESFEYLKKAEEIELKIDDPTGLGHVYHNLGSYYEKKKKYSTALDYFEKAAKTREEISDKRGLSSTMRNIGHIHLKTGKLDHALRSAEKSLTLAQSADAVEMIMESSSLLKLIYESKGDYKNAFAMSELSLKMKDSLANEDTRKATMRQNIEYEFQREKLKDSLEFAKKNEFQRLALANEKAESAKKDLELQGEQLFRYLLFGGLILVLVFSYFLYNRFKIIREQKHIIEERNKDIVDSINYAQRIQRSILPSTSKFDETFEDYFILYLPKDVVSGDFYWLETVHTTVKTETKDKVSVLAVVDCTGHGVPGALMSVVGNTLLNQTIKNPDVNSPGDALDFVNRELPKNLKKQNVDDVIRDGMDVAMCAIDRLSNKLYFAGANNPLYHLRNGVLTEYKGDKQAISGADDFMKINFTNHTVPIESGDAIYLFSDGYADQFGGDDKTEIKSGGKKFKYKRLKELLVSMNNLSMKEQRKILHDTIEKWKGEMEQTDDILLIGIRI